MENRRLPASLTACAVALITGCASTPGTVELNARNTRIEPLYRVQQPAGTAAGQYAVGRLHLAEGRTDAAILRFRNALILEPENGEALNGLGVAYGQQGRYELAVEAFRAALASMPDSAHLLNNLGFAQMKAGRLQEAAASLKRALALDPRDARARENLRQLIEARQHAPQETIIGVTAPLSPAGAAAPTGAAMRSIGSRAVAQAASVASTQIGELSMKPQAAVPVPERLAVVQDRPVPAAEATVAAVAAPAPVRSTQHAAGPSFEIVLAKANDGVLVQVAPSVYEIRLNSAIPETVAERAPLPAAATEPKPAPLRTSLAAIDRLEVSNGAGTNRLAARTAQRLSRMGAAVTHVTNYRSFGHQRTEIHYREGHAEDAKRLGERLPVDAKLVSVGQLRAGVDIRLVLGRDMAADDVAAWWEATPEVARSDGASGSRHL